MADDGKNISSGMGSGSAQVLKTSVSPYWAKAAEQKARDQAKKSAQEADNLSGVYGSLKSLNKLDVLPSDLTHFQDIGNKIKETVYNNIDALKKGDPLKMLELQKQLGDFENKASLAKNTKEQYDKIGQEILQGGYSKEAHDNYIKRVNDLQDPKSYEDLSAFKIDPAMFPKEPKKINLFKDFSSVLSPVLERAKTTGSIDIPQGDGTTRKVTTTELTDKDAEDLTKSYLTDVEIFNQAALDLKNDKAALQRYGDDVFSYYKNSYVNPFIKKELKIDLQGSTGSGGGDGSIILEPVSDENKMISPSQEKVYSDYEQKAVAQQEKGKQRIGKGFVPEPVKTREDFVKAQGIKVSESIPLKNVANARVVDVNGKEIDDVSDPRLTTWIDKKGKKEYGFIVKKKTGDEVKDRDTGEIEVAATYENTPIPLAGNMHIFKYLSKGDLSELKKAKPEVFKQQKESNAPHGDRVQTKDGWATWNGSKYVLEK